MTWLVTKRVTKFILRDKRLIALMLIVPIVMSLVIGYGFSGEIRNVKVVIVNLDDPTLIPLSATNNLTDYLKTKTDLVEVTEISFPTLQDWNESKQAVLNGDYKGAILFPENFTDTLIGRLLNISNDNTAIEVYLDNSNPQVSGSVIKALSEGFQFAFGFFFMSFILSIISLISERKAGTLDLLLLSPYRKVNIILGYLIPLSAVSVVQASILILLTIFAFNIPILGGAGAYFAIYFMLLLSGMSGMVLGFFLSTFAKTELQAIQFIPMITFTMLLLSGILVPLETLPRWLLPISYMLPLTYGAEYLRTVMM
ncbi:MAG: ABC transporter permease [Candidatus Heimdallarchaeota archaeon]